MVAPVLVLGVGNPLLRDEGVGVRVVEELQRSYTFPETVEMVDAGTMGMAILGLLRDRGLLVVVDALDGTGHPPGTVMLLDPSALADRQVMHSLHDVRLADVLDAAEFAGTRPETVFIGVQVSDMSEIEMRLTPEVEAAIVPAMVAVLTVLAGHGIAPRIHPDAGPAAVEASRAFEERLRERRAERGV